MSLAFGFALPHWKILSGGFSPAQLFTGGTPGPWFDGSDFSTMFQDRAGTLPVTALEQTVGLWLDKSQGLALGSELVTNGDFSSGTTGWTAGLGSIQNVSNTLQVTAASGASRGVTAITTVVGRWYRVIAAGRLVAGDNVRFRATTSSDGSGAGQVGISSSIIASVLETTSFWFNATATTTYIAALVNQSGAGASEGYFDNISVRELPGSHAVAPNDGSRGTVTARVNRLEGTAVLATQTVTVVAATHTLRFSGTGSVTLSGVATGTFSAGVHSVVCTAGSLTVTVTGQVLEADVRPSDQATGLIPTYQRVTTATDYDSTGFPVGVRFDGSDDSYSTAAINYSGTDKVTVFAGVRKNSDAATSAVAELSANSGTNNGTFLVLCDTVARYVTRSRGTSSADLNGTSSFASPITNVVAFVGEISTDTNILRVNGAQNASSTTDQGSGNFGNYPLFIGRRNNTNLPLNGTIYQLIAPGKLCSASEIAATEFYIRQKTKAY